MDLKKKSINILKGLQLKTGGILATTTKGAYPYVYTRDSVIITKALNFSGNYKNSEKFYYFLNKFCRINQFKEIFHRYTGKGWPCVTRKDEHDNTGLVLHGIYDTYFHSKNEDFLETLWPLIEKCVKFIFFTSKKGLVYGKRSIHEFYRLENGFEIWTNCACCRGLYDASKIAKILCHHDESRKWHLKAQDLEKNIKKKMFNKKTGLFMKNIKYPTVIDSSQLSPFYFDLINSKPILKKTLKSLKEHLWHQEIGGFRRFRKFEICKDWHWYSGGSGGWVVFTAWADRFYKELKDKKNQEKCREWLNQVGSKSNGLLPEHIATKEEYELWKAHETEYNYRILGGIKKTEEMNKYFKRKYNEDIVYWATPLGWSHAEYILLDKD